VLTVAAVATSFSVLDKVSHSGGGGQGEASILNGNISSGSSISSSESNFISSYSLGPSLGSSSRSFSRKLGTWSGCNAASSGTPGASTGWTGSTSGMFAAWSGEQRQSLYIARMHILRCIRYQIRNAHK
ncbi:hypothetical protein Tco_0253604, partial [Tanacetum coccineum]